MSNKIPASTADIIPKRLLEAKYISEELILKLFEIMPEDGLIFHGVKAKYAGEKIDYGIKRKSSSYFLLRKPNKNMLNDPISKGKCINEVREMFAHLYSYSGDYSNTINHQGPQEHQNRIIALRNTDAYLSANYYFGKEGANFLPFIFVAKTPDDFTDIYNANPKGIISVFHANSTPIRAENFLVIENLSYEEIIEGNPTSKIASKIIHALAEKTNTRTVQGNARRRLKEMGIEQESVLLRLIKKLL